MIRAALLLSAVVCFLQPFRASATGQAAERLVVGRDTMQLFALPLATADSAVLARLEKRLDELERAAKARFKEWTYGTYDGSAYRYRYENIGREEDVNLGCHYIYIRVLFRVLNIKNN